MANFIHHKTEKLPEGTVESLKKLSRILWIKGRNIAQKKDHKKYGFKEACKSCKMNIKAKTRKALEAYMKAHLLIHKPVVNSNIELTRPAGEMLHA